MNKDVIYIDVDDDITAIISKVKASGEKIVALVPPKRIGVLQSAVNLRLLHRAAEQGDKRLVIITSNHALMSLAASAKLPVARNLQSKPELAPVATIEEDDSEDVIDGNDLPIGEHVRQSEDSDYTNNRSRAATPLVGAAAAGSLAKPPSAGETVTPGKAKRGNGIPDFNSFRKKLIFGGIAGVLLIAFLVWATVFAPHATVLVSAKTNDSPVNTKATVSDKLSTDATKNTLKAQRAQKVDKKSIDFAATGSKNAGEKATGTVKLTQQSQSATAVPAGTQLSTDGGLVYVTDTAASVPASTIGGGCFPTACQGTTTVTVTAVESGAKYNAASGGLSGAPSPVAATLTGPTSGGTDRVVKIVTSQDIQRARQALTDAESKDAESQLKSQLKDAKYVQGSYKVDYTDIKSSPDVNGESASGNATLNATVTYSALGLNNSELSKYLNGVLEEKLGNSSDQRVYDDGAHKVDFQDVTNSKDATELTLIATAKVGPKLDESEIKKQSVGRKTGEIQEVVQRIQGIESVDIKYFPFWVTSVPNDVHKVGVQFKVNE